MSGLTASAGLAILCPNWNVSLFERRTDLCPLQQGSDSRWLHPHIYSWPQPGSQNPSAGLPILNWKEGRALDVADRILREWVELVKAKPPSIYVDTKHIKINANRREIEWIGSRLEVGSTETITKPCGERKCFDIIILAVGFGEEGGHEGYPVMSYWRNEALSQPRLDQKYQRYLVSGFGDGALIDLCRLRIERFRQDRIVDDLFKFDTKTELRVFRHLSSAATHSGKMFGALESLLTDGTFFGITFQPRAEIEKRYRCHSSLAGENIYIKHKSSIRSQVVSTKQNTAVFALQERSVYSSFEKLEEAVRKYGVESGRVICRYGTSSELQFRDLFDDYEQISAAVKRMRSKRDQEVAIQWPAGFWDNVEGK